MIILGIDPGTATTGYGVIKIEGAVKKKSMHAECIEYGHIGTHRSLKEASRLEELHSRVTGLIKKHNPEILAIENIYFFKNTKTAFPVAQAKGVILLAAAQHKIRVEEMSPPQIKMAVTGYGRADKKQIQKMIKFLLKLKEIPKPDDAADALAVALACSFSLRS